MLCLTLSCGKKKIKNFDDPYDLLEKTVHTSKWKRFTVTHPSGFWQVIKKEKWTLLYNNQDAPVQMVLDAKRHYLRVPDPEKRTNSFLKSFKAGQPELLDRDSFEIEGNQATRSIYTARVIFDYWDKFKVARKLEIIVFDKNKRSYLFAYIADEQNYDKYHDNFKVLLENFNTLEKKASKPGQASS